MVAQGRGGGRRIWLGSPSRRPPTARGSTPNGLAQHRRPFPSPGLAEPHRHAGVRRSVDVGTRLNNPPEVDSHHCTTLVAGEKSTLALECAAGDDVLLFVAG